jgi:hypothetical protein
MKERENSQEKRFKIRKGLNYIILLISTPFSFSVLLETDIKARGLKRCGHFHDIDHPIPLDGVIHSNTDD